MARDGYLILDSDLHMMEPDDLWARYLEGPHRASLPRFFGGQQQKLSESSEDKGHADTIMGMEVAGHPPLERRGASEARDRLSGSRAARPGPGVHDRDDLFRVEPQPGLGHVEGRPPEAEGRRQLEVAHEGPPLLELP
jgi:hypothetical protein